MSGPAQTPPDWQRLAEGALEGNPFFAPAITAASIEHFARRFVRVAAPGYGDRIAALAPIGPTHLGRIAPAVGVWTHRYAPLGTPLLDPAAPDAAAAALIAAMEAGVQGVILLFPDLPLDGAAASAIRAAATRARRPVAEVGAHRRAALICGPDLGALRDTLDRRRRKEFARQGRRLAERGELVYRRVVEGPEHKRAMLAFLDLEASGWKGRQGTALANDRRSRAFALDAIAAMPPGGATIDELILDGNPLAMLVSFRAGDVAVSWKIAHDERFARFSPGVQLMLEASDTWRADPTLAQVDSLAVADHPMIDGLWPGRTRIGLLALGPPGGSARFSLALRAAEAEIALRRRLRARRGKPASLRENTS